MIANRWLLGALHYFLRLFGAPRSTYTIAPDAHPPPGGMAQPSPAPPACS